LPSFPPIALDVAPETVSRWRKKPEYVAAIEAILNEARSEVAGRMVELTNKALDVVEQTLEYPFDRALKLRAAVALLQISGIGRAMSSRTVTQTTDQAEEAGT
jgi:hypothetical protein